MTVSQETIENLERVLKQADFVKMLNLNHLILKSPKIEIKSEG
jgi:hypothetical protein